MKEPYIGVERRKLPSLELLTKRVVTLELSSQRHEELLETVVQHMKGEHRKLLEEVADMKVICRSCICFGDDYK